jgi:hypothetical protein
MPVCSTGDEDRKGGYNQVGLETPWFPHVMVLDKKTGKTLALDEIETRTPFISHGEWSSLSSGVVNGKRLVFFGDGQGYVHAFEAPDKFPESKKPSKLKEVWICDINPPEFRYDENGKRRPVKCNDGIKFQNSREVLCPRKCIGAPTFYKNRIYITLGLDYMAGYKIGQRSFGSGGLVCIDASKTGDITKTGILWTQKKVQISFATPAITNGLVFITDHAGYLRCLDAETGNEYWEHDVKTKIWKYGAVAADGKIYIQNELSEFYILEASKEKKVLFETKLEGAAGPATGIGDGVIIVATKKNISAYYGKDYKKK